MFVTYRDENRSFQSLGIWEPVTANVTGLAEPEQVQGALVSGGVLQTLGVQPLLGRWLDQRDESPAAAQVAMLSYGYWQRRFGGDPAILGRTIEINAITAEIVGVMPPGFRFGDDEAEVIGPFSIDPARLIPPPFCCFGVARLKPGVSIEQANADLERLLPVWLDRFPFANGVSGSEVYLGGWQITPTLRTLKDDVVGTIGEVLWVVMAMMGIVLLIACANVTNLLLVRGEQRQLEFGVRAVLGAGSWPIARVVLAEAFLSAAAGGLAGVAVGYGALQLLIALAPPQLPRLAAIALDERSIAFAAVLTLVAGGLMSLAPMLRAVRVRLATALRGARGSSTGMVQQRTQNALVVGQVALALVLLVSSGLMIRTFQALRAVEPGFTGAESVQTFRVNIPQVLTPDPRDVFRQQRAIAAELSAIPGVSTVGFVNGLPMEGGSANWDGIDVEGAEYGVDGDLALRVFRTISPGYLETLGTRLVAGRRLDWTDLDDTHNVALVSESLARELWQNPEAALGKNIRTAGGQGPWREIVGVVEDVRLVGADRPAPAVVYWPGLISDFYAGLPLYVERSVAFAVRSPLAGTPGLARQIEQAVWQVNPSLPVANMRTMQAIYDRSLARTSFTLIMLALGAASALVLGIVGFYGVLSYAVSLRRREIAIRLALGARRRDVQRRFVHHGLTLGGLGVAIGLVGAAATTRLMRALLYDVESLDPLTYAAVAGGLALVALLASYISSLRATRVDPAESLAAE
jgi:predicted permease